MGWKRTPLWIFDGNREGCGKDTCADLTHVAYTGRSIVCAPLSKECDDEMRKRITSALMAGSRFFHLANMKGHVRYASLEAATDNSGVWEDRRLGVSETLTLPNETEFSFSANNATWEPDIERRCRRIRLRFTAEEINSHRYRYPDIKGWVRQHRAELLSAVAALVNEWVRQGCPPGPSPFTSFPEWGQVVGGILHCAGLPDPCLPHEDSQSSGDQSTRAMREFYQLAFDHFGDALIRKPDFQQFVNQTEEVHELFDWIDFAARQGQTRFGKLIVKFDKRELGGITFRLKQSSKNRADYRFFKEGEGELPTRPQEASFELNTRGHGDVWGHSPIANVGEKNAHEKNKKDNVLKALYISDRRTSPNLPMSPRGVFCSLRSDLNRIALDLTGASRVALDFATYGERKGRRLDPWKDDISLPSPSPRTASPTHAAPTRSPSSTASNGAASMPASTGSRCAPCGSSPSGGRGNAAIWHSNHFSEPSSKTAPSQCWGMAATAAISPTYPTWFVPSNSPSDSREADSRRSTWEQGKTIP